MVDCFAEERDFFRNAFCGKVAFGMLIGRRGKFGLRRLFFATEAEREGRLLHILFSVARQPHPHPLPQGRGGLALKLIPDCVYEIKKYNGIRPPPRWGRGWGHSHQHNEPEGVNTFQIRLFKLNF